jgi:hypothetical protein
MRLLSFRIDDRASFGSLIEERIVDLGKHLPEFDSLKEMLKAGALVRALDTAAEESPDFREHEISYRPPITQPERLFCLFDEPSGEPVIIDPPITVGHNTGIPCPALGDAVVWAGVAAVIGKPAAAIEASDARAHIAGLTLMLYLAPGGAARGPWLVTLDEIEALSGLKIKVKWGEADVDIDVPGIGKLVAHVSASHELIIGDVVAALHRIPDVPADDATEITITCDPIGTLRNVLDRDD